MMKKSILFFVILGGALFGDNQTQDVTMVKSQEGIPYTISIDLENLSVPGGWHSGAIATWGNKCLLVAGRTNGLHGFDNGNVNNFPPQYQNKTLFVIDFKKMQVSYRSLDDPASNLSQEQIDILSVTSPESYQSGGTLYLAGGYGIDSNTGQMGTKPWLSALDIPKIISFVEKKKGNLAKHIRQITHPLIQVTGGFMDQPGLHEPSLLIFGQNFTGLYTPSSNGDYTEEVRKFRILDDGKNLHILDEKMDFKKNPAYRRRDLNIEPVMRPGKNHPVPSYMAFSGVFTLSGGIWTVPVSISKGGKTFMANPLNENTFKQAMNNYTSPTLDLYSNKKKEMFVTIFGGLTYGYFDNDTFNKDSEIPFTNEITTIRIDAKDNFSQHLMDNEYPVIYSTTVNPGNPLLFGAGGQFVLADKLPTYENGCLALDKLKTGDTLVGYIVGGIQSTLPNTNSRFDSAASPYIFKVTLNKSL